MFHFSEKIANICSLSFVAVYAFSYLVNDFSYVQPYFEIVSLMIITSVLVELFYNLLVG